MEIYIAILISAAVFCAGLAIGSVITLQIQKRLKKKEEESVKDAYSEIYEKMQLHFENLSNKIYK